MVKKEWFERLADRLREKGKMLEIKDREGKHLYLERYYLHPRWVTLGLFRVVLHRFMRSDDPNDGLHCHPWPYISRILKGGYWETTEDKNGQQWCDWRGKGDWLFRWATHRHRVELHTHEHKLYRDSRDMMLDRPYRVDTTTEKCWTLFIMGPRLRTWKFYVDGIAYRWDEWIAKRGGL